MIVHHAHKGNVLGVKFSPDGRLLATSGGDGSCCVWVVSSMECISKINAAFPDSQLDFSHDSRYFAFGGFDPRVIDLAFGAGEVPLEGVGPTFGMAFHPAKHRLFAFRMSDSQFWSWNLPSGSVAARVPIAEYLLPGMLRPRQVCLFSPDAGHLLICLEKNSGLNSAKGEPLSVSILAACDPETGQVLFDFTLPKPARYPSPTAIRISADGSMLAAAHGDRIRIWDVKSHKQLAFFKAGGRHLRDLCFNLDGTSLLTVSYDETVRVWDAKTWQQIGTYDWLIGKLTCIDVAPDGLRYAAGGSSGKVVVWDAE